MARLPRVSIKEGFIIIDPQTGSGAYKIGGGGNGAFVLFGTILIGIMMW